MIRDIALYQKTGGSYALGRVDRWSIEHTDWRTCRPRANWLAISKFVGVTHTCCAAVRTSRRQRSKPAIEFSKPSFRF
jgi:hypothetical protein